MDYIATDCSVAIFLKKHFVLFDWQPLNLPVHKTYFNWSSGKDASLALHYLLRDKNYSIDHLLTSVNSFHNRVSMHGLRRELLQQQVQSLDIASSTIELPEQPSMTEYETVMKQKLSWLKTEGFTHAAFGDIFLEDLRKYREEQLASVGIDAVFPLWKRNTRELLHELVAQGFKSILICTNGQLLDASFAGRVIDHDFINDLPDTVDPCGENGEFHTFCFDGPIFRQPVAFAVGEKIYREYKSPDNDSNKNMGFWFCDLLPVT